MFNHFNNDTVAAIATPPGKSAIGIVRLSGINSLNIVSSIFKGHDLLKAKSHTMHVGMILDENEKMIDEVVVSVFLNPRSYTGEDLVEISCHGSMYILNEVLRVLVVKGARQAEPGEFTLRAFLNGKLDLSQAEAVADIIDSESKAANQVAISQIKGQFSLKLIKIREQLLNIVSLFELELDFAEEDVEFATNYQLLDILNELINELKYLTDSFKAGNVMKKGVSVVIAGKPNAGKSTLLNTLLQEERAITSNIPGTTRDFIEDYITIDGIVFRFVDTAGLTESNDFLEQSGIQKTIEKIREADLIIYLFDITKLKDQESDNSLEILKGKDNILFVANKIDKLSDSERVTSISEIQKTNTDTIFISSKFQQNIELVKDSLVKKLNLEKYSGDQAIVSNVRHWEILRKMSENIIEVKNNIEIGITKDLISIDLKVILDQIGMITGEVSNEEILGNIFSRFCIGK